MNYWKQQKRRNTIVTNYERSLGHAKGAPLFVRTLAAPVAARVVGIVQTVDTNAPKRKVLKNGKRRIVFK